MAATSYADIYDPEELKLLIGEKWANDSKVAQSGIVEMSSAPLQGSLQTNIRQKRFQGNSGQALLAGAAITVSNKEQESVNSPVIWRYDGAEDPDAIIDIQVKDIPQINADMAGEIKEASMEYFDDSAIAITEGVSANLTSHQFDGSASIITLDSIIDTKALTGDRNSSIDNGGIVLPSKVYWDAVSAGLVAFTANTYGVELQNEMARTGQLPSTILGLTPIVTDKLTKPTNYYTYLVGNGAIKAQGNSAPKVEVQRKQYAKSTITLFDLRYGMGVRGMNWTLAGKENVTDAELATNTSWAIASTVQNDNIVPIYRLETL